MDAAHQRHVPPPRTPQEIEAVFAKNRSAEARAAAVARKVADHVALDVCTPSGNIDAGALRKIAQCLHNRLHPMMVAIPSCGSVRMVNYALQMLTTHGALSQDSLRDFVSTYALLLCGFHRSGHVWHIDRARLSLLLSRMERFAYLHDVTANFADSYDTHSASHGSDSSNKENHALEKGQDRGRDMDRQQLLNLHYESAWCNMNPQLCTVVYGKDTCPYCKQAKQLLDQHNIAYRYVDVAKSDLSLSELVDRNVDTVPQVFVDGKYVGGFAELEKLLSSRTSTDSPSDKNAAVVAGSSRGPPTGGHGAASADPSVATEYDTQSSDGTDAQNAELASDDSSGDSDADSALAEFSDVRAMFL